MFIKNAINFDRISPSKCLFRWKLLSEFTWKQGLGQNYIDVFLRSYASCLTYDLVFKVYKLLLSNHNILCNFLYSPCPFENDQINPILEREKWIRKMVECCRFKYVFVFFCLYFHYNDCSILFIFKFLRGCSNISLVINIVSFNIDYMAASW